MKLTALRAYQLEKIGKMTLGFFLFMGLQVNILEGVSIIVLILPRRSRRLKKINLICFINLLINHVNQKEDVLKRA
jgi:hypothetical protein